MTAKDAWKLVRDSVIDFIDGDASMLGAALSFYTMLALSPLLIIVLALASPFYGRDELRQQVVGRIWTRVGPQAATLINNLFDHLGSVRENSGLATVVGLLLILYATTRLFLHLKESLNLLWGVPRPPPMPIRAQIRLFIRQRLVSALVLLLIGLLVVVVLVMPAVQAGMREWLGFELPGGDGLWQVGHKLASFGLLTLFFAILYKMLPDVAIEWRDVWVGAAGTALLFVLVQALIGVYFDQSRPGSPYGTAGSLFVLLLWVYYQSQVFFLGAYLTHRYATRYGASSAKTPRLPKPEAAVGTPAPEPSGAVKPSVTTEASG